MRGSGRGRSGWGDPKSQIIKSLALLISNKKSHFTKEVSILLFVIFGLIYNSAFFFFFGCVDILSTKKSLLPNI